MFLQNLIDSLPPDPLPVGARRLEHPPGFGVPKRTPWSRLGISHSVWLWARSVGIAPHINGKQEQTNGIQ